MPVRETQSQLAPLIVGIMVSWVWGWSTRTGHITLGKESFPLRKAEASVPICYVNAILGARGKKEKEKEREEERDSGSKLFIINKNVSVNC